MNKCFLEPDRIQDESIRASDEAITLYRLALRAGKFQYLPEPLLYYRVHSNSLTFTEDIELNKRGRMKALNLFFNEAQLPYHIIQLKRAAYAGAYFAVAHKYNDQRIKPTTALWNIAISFYYDPFKIKRTVRQVVRTLYLHLLFGLYNKTMCI